MFLELHCRTTSESGKEQGQSARSFSPAISSAARLMGYTWKLSSPCKWG